MPLHNNKCRACGLDFEKFVKWDERITKCPSCSGISDRVYTEFNGIKHDAPPWLKDTLEVVDKDGGSHCQDFLKHPNRDNYSNWMKGEGLRPMEDGEKLRKVTDKDKADRKKKRLREIKKNFKSREAITMGV